MSRRKIWSLLDQSFMSRVQTEYEAGGGSSESPRPLAPMQPKMRAEQKELTGAPSSPQREADRQSQRRTGNPS